MVRSEATSVAFRPTRSPKWPKRTAPTGRVRKARAKVASDWRVAAEGSPGGKKRAGKTRTEAVAKM